MVKPARRYKNSLFRRLTLFYLLISVLVIAGLSCAWIISNTSWLSRQMLSYDLRIMETLESTLEKQHTLLKQTQYRIYTYQLSEQTPLYELIRRYVRTTDMGADSDLLDYQLDKRQINEYISSIERPSVQGMNAFMITGDYYSPNDIFQRYRLDESIQGSARTIAENVRLSSSLPSRRSTYVVPSFMIGSERVYALYDALREYNSPHDTYGYLINVYRTQNLDNIVDNFAEPLSGSIYLLDSLGNEIYDSSGDYVKTPNNFDAIRANANGEFVDGELTYTVNYNSQFGFYAVSCFNNSAVFPEGRSNMITVLMVAALSIAVALLLTMMSMRNTIERMGLLLDGLKRARTNIRVRLPLTRPEDELYIITDETNKMLSRIETHIHRSLEQEIEHKNALLQQREAELYALQTQINPHSLYNTLEIIRMKALENGDEDCALMIKTLAQSFRERVKGRAVILLRQEMNTLRQMTDIYSMRYDSLLTINEEIDDAALDCAVLRDILTPVIENVFVHGIPEGIDPEEFEIAVSAIKSDGMLILRVTDNGNGIDEKRLAELKQTLANPRPESSGHVGLENIQSRINIIFGREYGITLSSRQGSGSSVEIRLPALSLEELSELATSRMPDYRINDN